MIKYILLNQKCGILDSLEAVKVTDKLEIEIENTGGYREPLITKLVKGDAVFYANVENGRCFFSRDALDGDFDVCVISGDGTVPCLGLTFIACTDGTVTVLPDVKDVLARLMDAEKALSDTLAATRELASKYNSLEDRLNKLFSGNYY
jgi:hypothetical protein